MFKRLMLLLLTVFACAPATEFSELSSYQARVANEYRYILTHTARLDGASDNDLTDEIPELAFDNYGQCFYRVISPQKLRLHRQDDLQQALATATKINDHYLPLSTVQKMIQRDRTLQELYASERHWLLPTVASFLVFPAIMSVDMLLFKGNGIIVENSKKIINKIPEGDKSLHKDIYKALHITADAEHTGDKVMQKAMTFGSKQKKGLRKTIREALIESGFAKGFAELVSKKCLGKRAAVCLVGYLAFFNSLFAVALPVLSDKVANSLARFFNRKSEQETLHNLLNDKDPLTQTQATSDKIIKTFEKKIQQQQTTDTASCPDAKTIMPITQLFLKEE